jgi:hypothetical protein
MLLSNLWRDEKVGAEYQNSSNSPKHITLSFLIVGRLIQIQQQTNLERRNQISGANLTKDTFQS